MSKETVFLSGATGYIAQHILGQLLETKKYKIVGSVRSQEKADALKTNFQNNEDLSFVFVDDIAKEDAFDAAFQKHGAEFDYILHTASPFTFEIKDNKKDLIIPAINGTKSIVQATVKYAPNVKKFVVTSSYAAVASPSADYIKSNTLNEETWNDQPLEEAVKDPIASYYYSKTAAERAVWDLHKSLNAKFKVTSINPVFVFGPQQFDSSVTKKLNTSCEFINGIVHSQLDDPVSNDIKGAFVDVRDVAKAQVAAIADDKLAGHRLILSAGRFSLQSLADIINKKYPQLKGKIARGVPGSDKEAIDSLATLDNHVTKELLGFEFIGLTESVMDTVNQILKVDASQNWDAITHMYFLYLIFINYMVGGVFFFIKIAYWFIQS